MPGRIVVVAAELRAADVVAVVVVVVDGVVVVVVAGRAVVVAAVLGCLFKFTIGLRVVAMRAGAGEDFAGRPSMSSTRSPLLVLAESGARVCAFITIDIGVSVAIALLVDCCCCCDGVLPACSRCMFCVVSEAGCCVWPASALLCGRVASPRCCCCCSRCSLSRGAATPASAGCCCCARCGCCCCCCTRLGLGG